MYDKVVEMQSKWCQFQMQMMQMMLSLINNQSRQPFPPLLEAFTQYPSRHNVYKSRGPQLRKILYNISNP